MEYTYPQYAHGRVIRRVTLDELLDDAAEIVCPKCADKCPGRYECGKVGYKAYQLRGCRDE